MDASTERVPRKVPYALTCVGLSLALSLTLTPATLPAFAQDGAADEQAASGALPLSVRGADALSVGGSSFDVATVVGLGAATLYADVSVDGTVRQHDLSYTFDNPDDQAGVVTLNAKAGYVASHSGALSLDFYTAPVADRASGDAPVLSAKVYAVAMMVDGQPAGSVEDSLVGIRTAAAGDETQPFAAPRLVVRGGNTYRLEGTGNAVPTLQDGVLYVNYQQVQQQGAEASITYVDEDGQVLLRDSLGALAENESQTVAVRQTVEAGGRVYVPVVKMPTVTLSAAQPEVIIHCLARREASADTQAVDISYVSTDGTALMRDRVDVGAGGYHYAPPTIFSQARSGSIERYVLTGGHDNRGNVYTRDEAAELSLTLSGAPQITLEYEPVAVQLDYAVSIALVSPAENGGVSVNTVERRTAQVSEGAPATVSLPDTYESDGETYTRASDEDSLTYSWEDFTAGRVPSDTVYYVRSDVKAPAAYDVEVRYVDVASGEQIGGETLSCTPDGEPLQIAGPASVEANGETYTRLTGQDAAIVHRFYAPYRTYTIYYARPGQALAGDVTVTRTVIEDGGTRSYVIDSSGNVSPDGGSLIAGAPYTTLTTPSGAGASSEAAGEQSSADNQSQVTAPDGEGAYEERIDDEGTPLAQDAGESQQPGWAEALSAWWPAVLAAVAAACAACIAFFARGRKRRAQEDSGSDEVKGA